MSSLKQLRRFYIVPKDLEAYTALNTRSRNTMGESADTKRNLIIVSNRLPVSVKRVDGAYQSSISSGGLVTALSGLTKSTQFRWFGWPGIEVKEPQDRVEVVKSLEEHNATPIFLDSDLSHEHYNGFSSKPISSSQ